MSKSAVIDPHRPVRLMPINIPKPWGQEIWYTGMETRGESQVLVGSTPVPLSTYLAHDPGALSNHQSVLLLKILDPAPTSVLGDLYFELHQEKQEVYVVTHVDPEAWPDGVGGIRFGMCQDKRKNYPDSNAFRQAYLNAVLDYEKIRRQIDAGDGIFDPATEPAARAHMESFTALRQLRVGDVVRVPTWTPHALQHGVRVVEFQTPTYERLIISFAQQVITQDHWDSEQAIKAMHLDEPAAEKFEAVSDGIERIARFDDFNVWRVSLDEQDTTALPEHIPYAVCMCLTGTAQLSELALSPEQACFVPHAALTDTTIKGAGKLLIAAPGL